MHLVRFAVCSGRRHIVYMELHRELCMRHVFDTVAALEGRRINVLFLDSEPIYEYQTPRELLLYGGHIYKLQTHVAREGFCAWLCRKLKKICC
jgi:hypothetical protein